MADMVSKFNVSLLAWPAGLASQHWCLEGQFRTRPHALTPSCPHALNPIAGAPLATSTHSAVSRLLSICSYAPALTL